MHHTTDVITDPEPAAVRPALPEGDTYFGLQPGTNGTAAMSRREAAAPAGFRWVRSNGLPATGLQRIPTNRSEFIAGPWSGHP